MQLPEDRGPEEIRIPYKDLPAPGTLITMAVGRYRITVENTGRPKRTPDIDTSGEPTAT